MKEEKRRSAEMRRGILSAGLLASTLALAHVFASAQEVKPEAMLDKDRILIGQQAQLSLSVSYRTDQNLRSVGWPNVGDTLTGKIDVVKDSGVDTLQPDKQNDPLLRRLTRTLTITSWDSGYWAVPPFVFTINGDTLETQPMLLTVNTVAVDTTAAIKDIKEIYEVPYGWMDWLREHWPWVAGGAAVAAILAWAIAWYVRRSRRPKTETAPAEPQKPLHVRTLLALEEVAKID